MIRLAILFASAYLCGCSWSPSGERSSSPPVLADIGPADDALVAEARDLLRGGDAVAAYALLTRKMAARARPSSLLLRKRADLALLVDAHELALQDLRAVDARGEASADDLLKLGLAQRMLGHLGQAAVSLSRAADAGGDSDLLHSSVLSLEAATKRWGAARDEARSSGSEGLSDWLLAAMRLDDRDEAMRAIGSMPRDSEDSKASESWAVFTVLIWFGGVDEARKLLAQQPKWPRGVAEIGMALTCRELGNWYDVQSLALKGYELGANGYVTSRLLALAALRLGDSEGYKKWGAMAEASRDGIDSDLPTLKH